MLEKNTASLLKIILLIAAILAGIWIAFAISWVIKLLVISLLLVYVLFPVTEFLKQRANLSHFLSVILTFSILFIIVVIFIVFIVPVVQKEMEEVLVDFPFYIQQLQRYLQDFMEYLETYDLDPEFLETITEVSADLQLLLDELASISISVLTSVLNIFFILFIVFYLLFDFHNVRASLINTIPPKYQDRAKEIMGIVDRNIGDYIRGNVIRCSIVGILSGSFLFSFGMPFALLFGLIAGVLNIILYIGPVMAAIPPLVLSFSPMTPSPFIVVAIYVGVQIIDGVLLAPVLLGKAVKLRPITIIVSLLIGQQLAGFLGMIIAVPAAGICRDLLEYRHKDEQNQHL